MDFKRWMMLDARIEALVENLIAEDKGEGFMSWFRRKHPIKQSTKGDCEDKVKKALQTLRDTLQGPEFEALLDELESKLNGEEGGIPTGEVDMDFGFMPDFTSF